MKLHTLIQAYDFNEIMPAIVDMFPGTSQYEAPLHQAWDLLRSMKPQPSNKPIRYKFFDQANNDETYVGASDRDFIAPWPVVLGKEIVKDKGVDLTDEQILANCLVNICFLGRHPKQFDKAYAVLTKPER